MNIPNVTVTVGSNKLNMEALELPISFIPIAKHNIDMKVEKNDIKTIANHPVGFNVICNSSFNVVYINNVRAAKLVI